MSTTITKFKSLSAAQIKALLPTDVTTAGKVVFTASAPGGIAGTSPTRDQLVQLVLKAENDNGSDSTHVAAAQNLVDTFLANLIPSPTPAPPAPSPSPSPAPTSNQTLYRAGHTVDQYVNQYPALQALQQPAAVWVGQWDNLPNVQDLDSGIISRITDDAKSKGQLPQFVCYNIPNRDNGGASAGGAQNATDYLRWIDEFVAALTVKSIVIVEPDALALGVGHDDLVAQAASKFGKAGHQVYVDIGHPGWRSVDDAARMLDVAGVGQVAGFSLNVSNFYPTADCQTYGEAISAALKAKGYPSAHFVTDVSRNGGHSDLSQWENPVGAKVGQAPTLNASGNCDALLWCKTPGESDGPNSTAGHQWPAAGTFDPVLAQCLVSGNWG